jgi:hypothetical protein
MVPDTWRYGREKLTSTSLYKQIADARVSRRRATPVNPITTIGLGSGVNFQRDVFEDLEQGSKGLKLDHKTSSTYELSRSYSNDE